MKSQIDYQKKFMQKLRNKKFVLVYQMGKVGSSTIEASLNEINIPNWHVHTFDDREEFQIYKNKNDVRCFFDWEKRLASNLLLSHRLSILQKRNQLKIITLVRDPIATIVSRFFQDLHIQFIEGKKTLAIHKDIDTTLTFLIEAFDKQVNYNYFTQWFDRELKRQFHVDIMPHLTNPQNHYWRIKDNNVDVLLLKCEAINDSVSELADFLNIEHFELKSSNEASNKWYSDLYRKFLASYPFERLFHLYETPLYQNIYSQEEINVFKDKWSKK